MLYVLCVCFSMCYMLVYVIWNISIGNVSLLQSRFQKTRYNDIISILECGHSKTFRGIGTSVSHMAQKIILNSP